MDEFEYASQFARAARSRLEQSDRLLFPETELVAIGVDPDGSVVILYRPRPQGGILGQRYVMAELRPLFDEQVAPATLAQYMVDDTILEPSSPGVPLDTPWADGLVDDPSEVRWVGVGE